MSSATFCKYLWMVGGLFVLLSALSCDENETAIEEKNSDADMDTESETEPSINDCAPISWPAEDVETVIDALKAALQEQENPSDVYVGLMPNHLSAFWDIPELGFHDAKEEIGCSGDWQFPPAKTEPAAVISQGQQQIFTDWRDEGGDLPKADAIGLSAKVADDMALPIDDAVAAGIPVVTFDSDVSGSNRRLFIGPLNEPAGETAANQMVELLGSDTEGKVLVIAGSQGETNVQERVEGIVAVFADEGRGDQLLDINWETGDDAVTPIAAAYEANSDLAGIILLNGTWGAPVGDWVVENGIDQLKIIAWDANETVLSYVSNEVIAATMAQREYYYGYLTTYVLYAMAALGVSETMALLAPYLSGENADLLNTGMDVIIPVNAEYYALYRSCLGISG